jgi:thiamine pyrophosphokinase
MHQSEPATDLGVVRRSAVVFAGGDPVPAAAAAWLPGDATVIAADAGLVHAVALGLDADVVIGDFDSVPADLLAAAEAAGAAVERHPAAKDSTDLELALHAARSTGAAHTIVVGGYGGRFDHLLANALVLASDDFAAMQVEAIIGTAHVAVVRHSVSLPGRTGELVSLIPVGGPARGVRTDGLRYPLCGEDLLPGSSRGVSNEIVTPPARVAVGAGTLLSVRPQALTEARP